MKTLKLASIISLLAISSSYAGDSAPLSGAGSPAQHPLATHSIVVAPSSSEGGSDTPALRTSAESSVAENVLENSADGVNQPLLSGQDSSSFSEKAREFIAKHPRLNDWVQKINDKHPKIATIVVPIIGAVVKLAVSIVKIVKKEKESVGGAAV